ncbi:MAG: hypothetical protein ACAI44_17970 [Candidatus Sericytochromatia bacterium]
MSTFHRVLGSWYRKTEALLRPVFYQREKTAVLRRFPHLQPVMDAFERHYIRVEHGAHDLSLMERIQRKLTDQDAYVYGTTPWKTFIKIADSLELKPEDSFIEVGCGTGHLCFLMNLAYGLKAQGIEAIATFIQTANTIRRELLAAGLDKQVLARLNFYNLDFFTCDLSRGTVFYIAGTCFPDDYRNRLIEKIAHESPAGSTVITLTHEIPHPAYRFSHQVDGLFSWGRDKALVYRLEAGQSQAADQEGENPDAEKKPSGDKLKQQTQNPKRKQKRKENRSS